MTGLPQRSKRGKILVDKTSGDFLLIFSVMFPPQAHHFTRRIAAFSH